MLANPDSEPDAANLFKEYDVSGYKQKKLENLFGALKVARKK